MLSIAENEVAEELDRFRNLARHGTCTWIDDRKWFTQWQKIHETGPHFLWISGAPAAGKSVLAASIANGILKMNGENFCQYHNLTFENKAKRSASYLLRSLAYQIARDIPMFGDRLLRLAEEFGISFENMSATTLWEKIFQGLVFKMTLASPLWWIIDGLDESESVSTIFWCLSKIKTHSLVIKILLVSRPTRDIQMRVEQSLAKYSKYTISPLDTRQDIRAFVKEEVGSIIPEGSPHYQRTVENVLAKASGNFLWVSLAMKALKRNWHTQSDIDQVINGFPSEMTPFYARMLQKLDEHEPRTRRLASTILTWATFSFRPLSVVELKTALNPEFSDFISLEDTMRHICGDFVRTQNSKVSLIHETARLFLVSTTRHNLIQMTSNEGHEYLATTCLEHLCSTKQRQWKQILSALEARTQFRDTCHNAGSLINNSHPFLSYAAETWAYHLNLAQPDSEPLRDILLDFFKNDALNWIYILALSGNLTSLINSAQYLKTFVKRREKLLWRTSSRTLSNDDNEFLRLWAVELIKLVGKFGSNIVQSPSSIYRLIPPFCPEGSMIRKHFGKVNSLFSVTGISNHEWDDCHARLSVGPDERASRLITTIEIIAALIPQAHCVIIWQTQTCEELRRIRHGEYLTEMAINKNGYLICTSGLRTLKVWEIGTGNRVASILKARESRVIALAFGTHDEEIIVGHQDHSIICHKWSTCETVFAFRAVAESHHYGDLRVMSFSPDGTQVAFVSRNRPVEIWDLNYKSQAYRCIIKEDIGKAEGDIGLPAEAIQWHPNSGRVYILYHNTCLVDWCPMFEEQIEHQVGAKEMVCSPEGNYLLTSDHCGTIKIFTLPDYEADEDRKLRLVYQLNYNEFVLDLAFSPDERRFYDIRESGINVWEPEVLVHSNATDPEADRMSSTGSFMSSAPAEAHQINRSQITAIVSSPDDFGFCCGRDDGELSIHEITCGKLVRSLPGHTIDTAIIALAWSSSGKWIASGDESGHVLVRKVQTPSARYAKMLVYKASDFRLEDGITQLLFSSDDKYLLVSTFSSDRIWDVSAKKISQTRKHHSQGQGKWIEHPINVTRLVLINAGKVHIFDWNSFLELTPENGLSFVPLDSDRKNIRELSSDAATETYSVHSSSIKRMDLATQGAFVEDRDLDETVDCIASTKDSKSVIFETQSNCSYNTDKPKGRRVQLIPTTALVPEAFEDCIKLEESILTLTGEVSKLIGSYQNHVMFFDHQHWLCTWELDGKVKSYKRHLFLPKDWLYADTLSLCVITTQGTLLCPKNGEVAIIRNGIKL